MQIVTVVATFISLIHFTRTQYYIPDGNDAYAWGKVPQSCECQQTGATPRDCAYFKCSCVCDLQAGTCDYGCCCDPDCSADQISRFTILGCKDNGASASSIQYCYSSDQLSKVNPRDPMGGPSAAEVALGEALCVERINYAVEGQYFISTDMKTSSIFNDPEGQKKYDYTQGNVVRTITPDAYYDQNDLIQVFYESSVSPGELLSVGAGVLSIPLSDSQGICNRYNYAQFEVNQISSDNDCFIEIPSSSSAFSNLCASVLNASTASTSLRIAMHANTFQQAFGVSDAIRADSVPIVPNQVILRNLTSGIDTDISDSWASRSGLSSAEGRVTCFGSLVEAAYTVVHLADAPSSIISASVDLVLADIDMPAVDSLVVSRTSIQFRTNSTEPVSQSLGNIVTRTKSGNPGYIMGAPIIFGTLLDPNAVNKVILQLIAGLAVPSPILTQASLATINHVPDGCPIDPIISGIPLSQSRGARYLKFGYDYAAMCSLQLNRQDLIQLCCEGQTNCNDRYSNTDSAFSDSTGLPFFLQATSGYIGIYGNADPLDLSQWTEISPSSITGFTRKWNDQLNTCTGMISSINYKFLVAYSGEQSNPQNKIVASAIEYATTDWSLDLSPYDENSKQRFSLGVTATFVFPEEQETVEYYPPPPPVLFKVPYDVFYPFL